MILSVCGMEGNMTKENETDTASIGEITIADGMATLTYVLEQDTKEELLINWYYLNTTEKGSVLAPIACSRPGHIIASCPLTYQAAGKYLIATVELPDGDEDTPPLLQVLSDRKVTRADVPKNGIRKFDFETDFTTFPTDWNRDCVNGGFLIDACAITGVNWERMPVSCQPFSYGTGVDGAAGKEGLLANGYGATLLYKVELNQEKLKEAGKSYKTGFSVTVCPEEESGAGFSQESDQFFDLFIKYDIEGKTGYGLRASRANKYEDTASFALCRYESGAAIPFAAPYAAACLKTPCTITLTVSDDTLTAYMATTVKPTEAQEETGLPQTLTLTASIEENYCYSVGFQYAGLGEEGNRILLSDLAVAFGSSCNT
jgi:hypothetical protein